MISEAGKTRAPAFSPLKIALGIFIGSASVVLLGVQASLVAIYADHLQLSLKEQGWVLATEQFGATAGALLGYVLATRVRWDQTTIAASLGALALSIATAYTETLSELMAARFGSGLFTAIVYTIALYFLGHTSKTDRVFGILMVVITAFFSVEAILVPLLTERFGYVVAIGSSAGWFGTAMVAGIWLPAGPSGTNSSALPPFNGTAREKSIVGIAALLGAFLLQVSIFAVWGFLDRIGRNNGLSDMQVGYAVGIGALGGIPGGLLPALIGGRFGRLRMIALSALVLVASDVSLGRSLTMSACVLWITILNFGWVLGLTYYMGLTVAHDTNGHLTRLMPFSQFFAAGVGPACSSIVIVNDQLKPIFVVAIVAAIGGLAVVVSASRFVDFCKGATDAQ